MSDRPELDIHQQTAFGEDGQLEVTRSIESDQSNLFAETADDQQTLTVMMP